MVVLNLPRSFVFPILINFILVASSVADSLEQSVRLNNRVKACNKISVEDVITHNNVVLANSKITSIQSAGYCGCKSALLSYSVLLGDSGKNVQGEYGTFSSFHNGKFTFVVDKNYVNKHNNKQYRLSIQCAPPE